MRIGPGRGGPRLAVAGTLALLLATPVRLALAQEEDAPAAGEPASPPAPAPPTILLEEIVVTAPPLAGEPPPPAPPAEPPARAPTPPADATETGIAVRTIPREAIADQGARSVAEVLQHHPAIDVSANSRGERSVRLRGFDQRETVVLLDGVPTYIPYDGQLDLDLVPADLIDHVTVVAGPASVLWGSNGLGGAINVVTRRPGEGPAAETAFETSARGDGSRLEAINSMRLGPVGWVIAGGVDDRRGFPLSGSFEPARNEDGGQRNNSDRRLRRLLGTVELDLGPDHRLRLSGFVIDAARGIPPSTVAADSRVRWWRMNAWRALGASLGHSGTYGDGAQLDELAWVRIYDNLFDSYDDASYSSQELPRAFHTWYRDRSFGGRVRLSWPLLVGDWASTLRVLTEVQHDRHREDAYDYAELDRTILTLAPQYEQTFDRDWQVTAGFQLDVEFPGEVPDVSLDPTVGWGPLVSLRWKPREDFSVELVAARRSRFPTLKERFSYALGQRDPNPTLGPEAAWHFGAEIAWRPLSWLEVHVAGYDAEVAGLISPVHISSMLDQLQNVDSARLAGAELQVSVAPLDELRIEVSYRYLFARQLDVAPPRDVLPYRPEHTASLSVVAEPWAWLGLSTSVRLTGPQQFENPETLAWATLGTFVEWDARVDFRPFAWLDVYARATNLLDAKYQTEYGFPEPGWQLWLGLRVTCDSFADGCSAEEPSDG